MPDGVVDMHRHRIVLALAVAASLLAACDGSREPAAPPALAEARGIAAPAPGDPGLMLATDGSADVSDLHPRL